MHVAVVKMKRGKSLRRLLIAATHTACQDRRFPRFEYKVHFNSRLVGLNIAFEDPVIMKELFRFRHRE